MQLACDGLTLTADDAKKASQAKDLNARVIILVKYHARLSAALSVVQAYGNVGSHHPEPLNQPNNMQVASNAYDFCLVACHRLIHTFNLLVNEIAPKDAKGLPDLLSKFPAGKKSGFSYNKDAGDLMDKVGVGISIQSKYR